MGLTELSQLSGLDKATTHRLAQILARSGHLEQDASTRQYRVGIRVLDFGFAFLADIDVRQRALPAMQALSAEFGGSVSLSVLDGIDVVYIERIPAKQFQVGSSMRIGSRAPAYCSSMGKATLAWLPPEQLEQVLGRHAQFEKLTPRTITDPEQLRSQLAEVRRKGYAVNDEEMVLGLRSVAAAIRDRLGAPVAALNVAVASAQWPRRTLESQIAPAVRQAAGTISGQLGFVATARRERKRSTVLSPRAQDPSGRLPTTQSAGGESM